MAACKQAFFFGDEASHADVFQGFAARFFPTKEQPLPLRGEGTRDEALGMSAWKAK